MDKTNEEIKEKKIRMSTPPQVVLTPIIPIIGDAVLSPLGVSLPCWLGCNEGGMYNGRSGLSTDLTNMIISFFNATTCIVFARCSKRACGFSSLGLKKNPSTALVNMRRFVLNPNTQTLYLRVLSAVCVRVEFIEVSSEKFRPKFLLDNPNMTASDIDAKKMSWKSFELPILPSSLREFRLVTDNLISVGELMRAISGCASFIERMTIQSLEDDYEFIDSLKFPCLQELDLTSQGREDMEFRRHLPIIRNAPNLKRLRYRGIGHAFGHVLNGELMDSLDWKSFPKNLGLLQLMNHYDIANLNLLNTQNLKTIIIIHKDLVYTGLLAQHYWKFPLGCEELYIANTTIGPANNNAAWYRFSHLRKFEMYGDESDPNEIRIPEIDHLAHYCLLIETFIFHVNNGDPKNIEIIYEWIDDLQRDKNDHIKPLIGNKSDNKVNAKPSSFILPNLKLLVFWNRQNPHSTLDMETKDIEKKLENLKILRPDLHVIISYKTSFYWNSHRYNDFEASPVELRQDPIWRDEYHKRTRWIELSQPDLTCDKRRLESPGVFVNWRLTAHREVTQFTHQPSISECYP